MLVNRDISKLKPNHPLLIQRDRIIRLASDINDSTREYPDIEDLRALAEIQMDTHSWAQTGLAGGLLGEYK